MHGHTLLTELFTVDTVPGLLAALTELRDQSLAGIGRGLTLTGLLKANVLPEVLREHPAAVGPYLAIRDHFVQRLYHQHSGYWQPDGQGLEPVDPADRAAALDLLAGGRPEQFASAARTLLAQRDPALALEIITAGLASHPDAGELAQLRHQALYRLIPADGTAPAAGPVPLPHLRRAGGSRNRTGRLNMGDQCPLVSVSIFGRASRGCGRCGPW